MIDIIIPTLKSRADIDGLVKEAAETAGCDVTVTATCLEASAAQNRNFGLDNSSSDPVIMIDDDMEGFPDGWVVALVKVLDDYPDCVMVSPQLAAPNGSAGFMMGGCRVAKQGTTVAVGKRLPTACVAFRRTDLRFDEIYTGSGFEDDDYCHQLVQRFPNAEFRVCHDVWVVHRNEKKNQHGKFWPRNQALYKEKWGLR